MLKCLLDMDGVLVDFVKGVCKAHSRENPYNTISNLGIFEMENIWGMSPNDYWEPCNSVEFWENLTWMPDGKQILEAVELAFGKDNICLLSSPSRSELSMVGKLRWIKKHIPGYERKFLFGASSNKQLCASHSNILIDDYDRNVKQFKQCGGFTLLVPRPWNALHKEAHNSLTHVKMGLKLIKD